MGQQQVELLMVGDPVEQHSLVLHWGGSRAPLGQRPYCSLCVIPQQFGADAQVDSLARCLEGQLEASSQSLTMRLFRDFLLGSESAGQLPINRRSLRRGEAPDESHHLRTAVHPFGEASYVSEHDSPPTTGRSRNSQVLPAA